MLGLFDVCLLLMESIAEFGESFNELILSEHVVLQKIIKLNQAVAFTTPEYAFSELQHLIYSHILDQNILKKVLLHFLSPLKQTFLFLSLTPQRPVLCFVLLNLAVFILLLLPSFLLEVSGWLLLQMRMILFSLEAMSDGGRGDYQCVFCVLMSLFDQLLPVFD